jgi:hypothetical protein
MLLDGFTGGGSDDGSDGFKSDIEIEFIPNLNILPDPLDMEDMTWLLSEVGVTIYDLDPDQPTSLVTTLFRICTVQQARINELSDRIDKLQTESTGKPASVINFHVEGNVSVQEEQA